ncbi:MAG: hypothetical protein K1X29_07325 [Bdellovibrionales bacterium]|nr:hypothetical protein [Bdellovibrionales bacterium]
MTKLKIIFLLFGILFLVVGFQNCGSEHQLGNNSTSNNSLSSIQFQNLQNKALEILSNRCAKCHGGGIGSNTPNIMDLNELKTTKFIVPGHPESSPIYLAIIDGLMPQDFKMIDNAPAEVVILREWIHEM